jgi:hypothetical protein
MADAFQTIAAIIAGAGPVPTPEQVMAEIEREKQAETEGKQQKRQAAEADDQRRAAALDLIAAESNE